MNRSYSNPLLKKWLLICTAALTLFVLLPVLQAAPGDLQRVSLGANGVEGNHESHEPSVSADGRYVAFDSRASNLVNGDTNDKDDCFVRDLETGLTERVSVSADENEANGNCAWPAISADGRFVAFESNASNLVPNDNNGTWDIFVRDRQIGETYRVSVATGNVEGNEQSRFPRISSDGQFVSFDSQATNLVISDTNGTYDVFVHDLQSGITTRVSINTGGSEGNDFSRTSSISGDGRYVAFESQATNLVNGDTNDRRDIFVRDRNTGTTTRVSVASDGTQGNWNSSWPAMSDNGRVAFSSDATTLVDNDPNGTTEDIFVHDLQSGETTLVSVSSDEENGNGDSELPTISADGRFVAFKSEATNLVPAANDGTENVFLRDTLLGTTTLVSVSTGGSGGNGEAVFPDLAADGGYVVFESSASNLIGNDTNDESDIFLYETAGSLVLDQKVFVPLVAK
ncbi:MAG: hypothetical protein QNJ45_17760 [Ardenticatenaceae bacterium]|nr:hypothetical protein [Ardenticatenaceae bacterium]